MSLVGTIRYQLLTLEELPDPSLFNHDGERNPAGIH